MSVGRHTCYQPLLGELAMRIVTPVSKRMYGDASPRGKQSDDFYVSRLHEFPQVIQYDVNAVLVEVPMIAETEQVKLQALALDHLKIGYVIDDDASKVGLSGLRTERCKLRAVESDEVITLRMQILE